MSPQNGQMVQVDLDYTFAGGKRENGKIEETNGTAAATTEDCDLLEVEGTIGGENGRVRRKSNKKEAPTPTSKFKKEGGYQLMKERQVKVIIIKTHCRPTSTFNIDWIWQRSQMVIIFTTNTSPINQHHLPDWVLAGGNKWGKGEGVQAAFNTQVLWKCFTLPPQ